MMNWLLAALFSCVFALSLLALLRFIDAKGLVNEWNNKAVEITSFTRQEVVGRDLVQEVITERPRHFETAAKTIQVLPGESRIPRCFLAICCSYCVRAGISHMHTLQDGIRHRALHALEQFPLMSLDSVLWDTLERVTTVL